MHVERYGHGGAPILLVHGFGTCSFLWRAVGPALAMANRTAFAIDLFGHGESDRPFDAQFGISAQSEYLDRALTALRLSKATVVGIDLGAAVAMHLAYVRPDRVDRQEIELGQIDRPTLIIVGDHDQFVSPRIAETLADTIPGSRLVRVPGVGRLVPEEAPDQLSNLILEFLGVTSMARSE